MPSKLVWIYRFRVARRNVALQFARDFYTEARCGTRLGWLEIGCDGRCVAEYIAYVYRLDQNREIRSHGNCFRHSPENIISGRQMRSTERGSSLRCARKCRYTDADGRMVYVGFPHYRVCVVARRWDRITHLAQS
jgi:hypothetical protein